MGDDETDQPIEQGRPKHQRDEARLGPPVKGVSKYYEDKIAPALRSAEERIVNQQRERQEIENEKVRAEDHGSQRPELTL
jgi:hypothetical protein